MSRISFAAGVAALIVGLSAAAANADVIPYPDPGTENPENFTYTAAYDGDIVAYFYASDAAYTEEIGLLINGVSTGVFGLNNHTSNVGDSVVLGHVHAGDMLTFVDKIIAGPPAVPAFWYSDPSMNSDGAQHVYSTVFSGNALIPAGTYFGFEDLPAGRADWDYNDVQFVFTDMGSGVPEAPTWGLMLLGFVGLGFAGYRESKKSSAPA